MLHYSPVTAADTARWRGFTRPKAIALLKQDVARFEQAVTHAVHVPLKQAQFDALVSFAFNIGAAGLSGSSAVAALNARQYSRVPELLHNWDDKGLLTGRRTREGSLFAHGDYGPGITVPPPVVRLIRAPYFKWVAWRLGEGAFKRDGPANAKDRPKSWLRAVPKRYFPRFAAYLRRRH